jgi:hypothetical protein
VAPVPGLSTIVHWFNRYNTSLHLDVLGSHWHIGLASGFMEGDGFVPDQQNVGKTPFPVSLKARKHDSCQRSATDPSYITWQGILWCMCIPYTTHRPMLWAHCILTVHSRTLPELRAPLTAIRRRGGRRVTYLHYDVNADVYLPLSGSSVPERLHAGRELPFRHSL